MTVKELIESLRKLPQDKEVCCFGSDNELIRLGSIKTGNQHGEYEGVLLDNEILIIFNEIRR